MNGAAAAAGVKYYLNGVEVSYVKALHAVIAVRSDDALSYWERHATDEDARDELNEFVPALEIIVP